MYREACFYLKHGGDLPLKIIGKKNDFHKALIKREWSFLERVFIDLQIRTRRLNYLSLMERQWRDSVKQTVKQRAS